MAFLIQAEVQHMITMAQSLGGGWKLLLLRFLYIKQHYINSRWILISDVHYVKDVYYEP